MFVERLIPMKKLVAVLYIAFSITLALGQTVSPREGTVSATNPLVDRLERLSKGFPPELAAPTNDRDTVKMSRSFCVYPSPDSRSLSIKPCPAVAWRLRLLPPLQKGMPATPNRRP